MRSTWSKVGIYFVAPFVIVLPMAWMYFSGDIVLQRIICPKLPPLPPDSWREFGLLEGAQKLVLLLMLLTTLAAVFRKKDTRERIVWGVLSFFVAFVLLEELDYGVHWYRLATLEEHAGWFTPAKDWDPALVAKIDTSLPNVNLHNQGFTDAFKLLGDAALVVFFLLIPWGLGWIRRVAARFPRLDPDWINYLAADRFAVLGLIAMLILRFIVHESAERGHGIIVLDGLREPGAMESNLSEFRELATYYLFAVYLAGVVFFRRSPGEVREG